MSKPGSNGNNKTHTEKYISQGDTVTLILGILLVLFFLAAGIISLRESSTGENVKSRGPVRNPKALNKTQNSSCLPMYHQGTERWVGIAFVKVT
jgi:hypothetical protein